MNDDIPLWVVGDLLEHPHTPDAVWRVTQLYVDFLQVRIEFVGGPEKFRLAFYNRAYVSNECFYEANAMTVLALAASE